MNDRKVFNKYVGEAIDDMKKKMGVFNDKKVEVTGANRKMNTFNEYVCVFITNLNRIIKHYNLRMQEIRVLLQILEYMRFGNLISLSLKTLSEDTGMDKGNISRSMKRLKETGVIVEDRGSLYFNPHIVFKGYLDENEEDDRHLLDTAAVALDELHSPASPSIGTPAIRESRKVKQDA